MKFNKININRAPLTADEISAAMDFDGLINNPPAVSQPTSPTAGAGRFFKLVSYGIGVAAVAGWFFMNKSEQNQAENTEHIVPVHQVAEEKSPEEKNTLLINPPLKDVELPFESAVVSVEKSSEVTLGSSIIKVPKDCFVDKNGAPVTGEVELKYREFNTNLDIFLSGIPMKYDSAGVNYTFESNGMFEIRGYQNGELVEVAPEKELEIAMEIEDIKSGFSEYYLNEETGNWDFKNGQNYEVGDESYVSNEEKLFGDGEITDFTSNLFVKRIDGSENDSNWQPTEELIKNTKETAKLDAEIKQIEKEKKKRQKPVKPKKADRDVPQIALEVDFKDFPELKAFKNTLFQVAEKDLGTFDAKWGEETWNDIGISKSTLEGHYRIVFSRPGKRVRVTCAPVVTNAEFPKATSHYKSLLTQYNFSLDSLNQVKREKELERKGALAKAREEAREQARIASEQLAARQQEARDKQRQMTEDQRAAILAQQQREKATNKLSAVFRANQFGYYNCDRPLGRITGSRKILASYETDLENQVSAVSMIEAGRKAVFYRYQGFSAELNSGKKNTFFAVTDQNTLAVAEVEPNELKDKKSCVIKMKECEEKISTRQQVETFLKEQGIEL